MWTRNKITRREFTKTAAGLFVPALFGIFVPSVAAQMRKKKIVIGGGGITDPTSISGLVAWWDGNDSTKIYKETSFTTQVSADGDAVNGWKDKSGNANDLVATTSVTTQATWKTNVKNGKAVVRFNGTASQFTKSLGSLSAHTVIAAFVESNTSGSGYGTLMLSNSGLHGFQMKRQATSLYMLDYYGGADHDSATIAAGTWSLATWDLSGTGTFNAWKNGVQYFTNQTGADSSVTYDRVGGHGSEWMQGDIGDLIVYNRALNATERGQVESWLQTKWGTIP